VAAAAAAAVAVAVAAAAAAKSMKNFRQPYQELRQHLNLL